MSYRLHSTIKRVVWGDLHQWFMVKSLQLLLHSSLSYTFAIVLNTSMDFIFRRIDKKSFLQSGKFFTIREIFDNQESFRRSGKLFTIMEVYHDQWSFLQSTKFPSIKQRLFSWSRNFSIRKDFCKQIFLIYTILKILGENIFPLSFLVTIKSHKYLHKGWVVFNKVILNIYIFFSIKES